MHPILARPVRVAAYLGVWFPLGMLLTSLLALQGVFGWTDAALVALPLSIGYGFLCLSSWYVTGGSPVDRGSRPMTPRPPLLRRRRRRSR